MTSNEIITAIVGGQADDGIDRIFDALKSRRRTLTTIRVLTSDIRAGDKVRLSGLRPAYINGHTGTVVTVKQTRAVVKLDTSIPRFGSSPSVPISCLEKVN